MVNISNNHLANLQSFKLNATTPTISLFKVGQILSVNIENIQGKQVQMNIGGQSLIATSKEPIQATGTVQVQIKQLQPSLELVIVKTDKPSTAQQAQQTLQTAYRQLIPNQQGITQALQQVNLMQSLPASLSGPVNQLLDQLSKTNTALTGKDLKNKIANSGLFLENKLSKSEKPNLKNDVKAQLLQINQQAQSLNSKSFSPQLALLTGTLAQAINRLTVQQLQLYENPHITALELPFNSDRTINESSIELRRHPKSSALSWEVLVDISLPQGEMSSKLILNRQDELSCLIWCETNELETLVSEKLEVLSEQLSATGLEIKAVQTVKQKPVKTDKTTQIALIDIHI